MFQARRCYRLLCIASGLALGLTACTQGLESDRIAQQAPPVEAVAGSELTVPPDSTIPATTPAPTTTVPTPTPEPPPPPFPSDGLSPGDEGEVVERLQTELHELGFRTGHEIDGVYGAGTTSAVMAFEKFEGLERDGIADSDMLAVLQEPTGWLPLNSAAESRIEIDITRQLIFARDDTGDITILNTSTGNGQPYKATNGKYYNANTPRGEFEIERRINGVRRAFLGSLYRPLYFKRGWAIHGSNNVPGYPASHGCARVSNDDQDWLYETFRNGTFVAVYDEPVEAPEYAAPDDPTVS